MIIPPRHLLPDSVGFDVSISGAAVFDLPVPYVQILFFSENDIAELARRIDTLDNQDRTFVEAGASEIRRALRVAQLDLARKGAERFGWDADQLNLTTDNQGSPRFIERAPMDDEIAKNTGMNTRTDATGKKTKGEEIECESDRKNKDTQSKGMADLCVSVSHSDRALAVAVSRHRIGIDIEDLRSLPKRPITLLFSDEECDTIVDDVSFTKAWVRKEAYAKWLGTGLRDSLAEGVYDTETHVTEWAGKNDRPLDEKLYIGLAGTDCPSAVIETRD